MTKDEIIQRLKAANRAKVARETKLGYGYLSKLVYETIKNPGHEQIDTLRNYFLSEDILGGQPGQHHAQAAPPPS